MPVHFSNSLHYFIDRSEYFVVAYFTADCSYIIELVPNRRRRRKSTRMEVISWKKILNKHTTSINSNLILINLFIFANSNIMLSFETRCGSNTNSGTVQIKCDACYLDVDIMNVFIHWQESSENFCNLERNFPFDSINDFCRFSHIWCSKESMCWPTAKQINAQGQGESW